MGIADNNLRILGILETHKAIITKLHETKFFFIGTMDNKIIFLGIL
jgi:hypothetical protein